MSETRKVVINTCHGGFGLSEDGVRAYAKRKGFDIWVVTTPSTFVPVFSRGPPDEFPEHNKAWDSAVLQDSDIARDDPDLVAVVEGLGARANGEYAHLSVVEIPSDVEWQIEDYDGAEHVAERHRVWTA